MKEDYERQVQKLVKLVDGATDVVDFVRVSGEWVEVMYGRKVSVRCVYALPHTYACVMKAMTILCVPCRCMVTNSKRHSNYTSNDRIAVVPAN